MAEENNEIKEVENIEERTGKEFIHLHNHTEYSLLDGAAKIKELVAKAAKEGASALAITDHGNIYGSIKFYKACQEKKIKPILGIETYIVEDRKVGVRKEKRYHLILLAKNYNGFKNLMRLSSIAFIEGFYERPRIDFELLSQYHDDLICLSACIAGEVPKKLINNDYEGAKEVATKYKNLFGDDYYIEIQNHGIREELEIYPLLMQLANELDIKTVITNDLHYIEKEDAKAHDILLCMQTGAKKDDPDRMRFPNDNFYYKSYDEMLECARGNEELLKTSLEIADKCNIEIPFHVYVNPVYKKIGNCKDDMEFLRYKTFEGLKERYEVVTDEIKKRATYELGVIEEMKFPSYFLVVWDYIEWARNNGVPVGPGRGSGAGSIVAYALGITQIDPLKYDLIFERFLNPERKSMPDIDVDFCSVGREKVIDYVRKEYGEDQVCQIITFGTMKIKNALKSVGRVYGVPFDEMNKLCKNLKPVYDKSVKIKDLLTKVDPSEIEKAQKAGKEIQDYYVPELAQQYETNDLYKEIIDVAAKLQNLPQSRGKHAAGVVICGKKLIDVTALSRNGDDITTAFDMSESEELGLLKMDFLALNTLTDIDGTLKFIKEYHNKTIDFSKLQYDDEKVFNMLGEGDTDMVFQLESSGMKDFMTKLKPNSLEEIIAGVSLYRPGPMQYIKDYIHNKFNPDQIKYPVDSIKDILKTTYGIVVYQEQAMKITQVMADFTMGGADTFRKVISKKKLEAIAEQGQKFVDGCINKKGIDEKIANDMWDRLKEFGKYAFNKSHAAAYSVVTYQTAYLKYYYFVEYVCSVLNNRIGKSDETTKYIGVAVKKGVKVLKPDINKSKAVFIPEDGNIRYGLACLKNVGVQAVNQIVQEREKNGPFSTFEDFISRVDSRLVNKKMMESLIKGGAFDLFGYSRATLLANYEEIARIENEKKGESDSLQLKFDLSFDQEEYKYKIVEDSNINKMLDEKEVSGRFITGSPFDGHEEAMKDFTFNTSMLFEADETDKENDDSNQEEGNIVYKVKEGQLIRFGGIISSISIKFTKKNTKYAQVVITDDFGDLDMTIFGRTYEKYMTLLQKNEFVIISGKITFENDKPKIDIMNMRKWDIYGENQYSSEK
ncbi:MAG: DNA polymerase III subunit alpha, partial [Clostridia bacterium]|nr:DNA polymerase III subunit alpha [Clostridia bacterium]